ncbi:GCN5-related N-acetyltransferase 3, chloroplastic isoform X2 [Silene latifolia]|uniref:GCN5-related N-acetyltransferase 3, chloroplastic isoform X2 n=1 Tax=Silene latifolia TaxID=37657 RepID=UPI003D77AC7F
MKMAITIRSSNKSILHQPINNELIYNGGEARKSKKPAILISTNPSNINISSLSHLYLSCNHSPHRLAAAADVDAGKLEVAVNHSAVVVSVFAKVGNDDEESGDGLWGVRMAPPSPKNGELIGFGRAVSDLGLTASIFDVMVIPTLRRLGIGRMIVHRIIRYPRFLITWKIKCNHAKPAILTDKLLSIKCNHPRFLITFAEILLPIFFRMLTNRGVYDISALCSDDQRLFFEACGFGDDLLGSTTMTYTETASSNCSRILQQWI